MILSSRFWVLRRFFIFHLCYYIAVLYSMLCWNSWCINFLCDFVMLKCHRISYLRAKILSSYSRIMIKFMSNMHIDVIENIGQQVLIIFYKVEPSDVLLNQNNSFEAALVKHEQRLGKDSDKVKGWRSALSRVCALPDKEHCRKNMYESELIKKIVKDTFAKLPPVQSQTKPIGGLGGSRFVIDYIYDVFLSFSNGTRYTFSDYLYDALSKKRIHTFRGDKGLIGEEISPDILEAIEKSRMSIIVLCENYASSARCLDELSKIVECFDNEGQHVSAIFYKVEPTNVRFQKETYEAAMNEHENRYGKGSEKVKAWRFALSRVCDISGQHLRDNAYEFKLIKKIVRDTFVKVSSGPSENKYLVGLDSCFEQMTLMIFVKEYSGSSKTEGIMLDPPQSEEVNDWIASLRLLDWELLKVPKRIDDFYLPHSRLSI
ncbi:hypothetical protein RIF29_13602 [Crotalaria pallida]|uniref:TIR domain-containing protein n=1 Tax=Crotalaria pallida TaxID=3830 RepID=A0AAN9IPU4_CROPI